ncbi:hypothetical protein [Sphingobacterium sp. CZ-2]|uniref:hypothetical protein n=1 Tax=Sphingobacterium sp. CZ-2 TaxID=2557994 RepID=UPI00106FE688|nr:hypothetical protein [Sphingobacterium sp. CZ-2]QBR10835.1 hypothetical protein E3D81_01085 [Sphingobacterium sp. CZ-2]
MIIDSNNKRRSVNNIDDLNAEIARLKRLKIEQEDFLKNQYSLLKHKIETPARIANMLMNRVPGVSTIKGLVQGIGEVTNKSNKSDWLTKTLQLGLPLVLNKTLLKNAGWIKKGLVLLASETAAKNVNQDNVSSWIGKITDMIKPKKKKKKNKVEAPVGEVINPVPPQHPPMITAEESVQDNIYGIPKDSEAY